jgi:hypothetical protein
LSNVERLVLSNVERLVLSNVERTPLNLPFWISPFT